MFKDYQILANSLGLFEGKRQPSESLDAKGWFF